MCNGYILSYTIMALIRKNVFKILGENRDNISSLENVQEYVKSQLCEPYDGRGYMRGENEGKEIAR